MSKNIPDAIKERMEHLEKIDERDRYDGTQRQDRLRQIPRVTGEFIAFMLTCAPEGKVIEVGTSAGYSTLWLAYACRETGRKITTFEVLDNKVRMAGETFAGAGVQDIVDLVKGDAREYLGSMNDIAFCFIDCEKEYYDDCYELIVPRMVKGGILIADNAISHGDELKPFLNKVSDDNRVNSMIVPIGSGELVCRKR